MKQKITKDNKNLVIKLSVPLKTHRSNPYDVENKSMDMDNIVGLIAGDKIGFAFRAVWEYPDNSLVEEL